ncbi:MAG: Nif3-like dinuclear metal center hexameric protein [Candidatus Poribacteria bacterium]
MNANEIREHLLSKAPWVDREKTVDTIKFGDPMKKINHVAVAWMSSIDNLRKADQLGCDLFITHEPTFWHHSQDEEPFRKEFPGIVKQKFLEKTGIVVLRVHDIWDPWPGIGIRDSWAKGLGLTNCIAEDDRKFVAVYEIPKTTLGDFARYVAEKVRPLGQDSVLVLGDPNWSISHPAVGTGCGTPGFDMIKKGADVVVVCDDGFSYWHSGERFYEMNVGVIMVSHGTSEMWGIENLARYIKETFAELKVTYLDKHPKYWSVCI